PLLAQVQGVLRRQPHRIPGQDGSRGGAPGRPARQATSLEPGIEDEEEYEDEEERWVIERLATVPQGPFLLSSFSPLLPFWWPQTNSVVLDMLFIGFRGAFASPSRRMSLRLSAILKKALH